MATKLAHAMHVICSLNSTQSAKADHVSAAAVSCLVNNINQKHCYMSCSFDSLVVVARLWLMQPGSDRSHSCRLSLKDLKLYGTVRVNLLEQAEGMSITKAQIQAALSQSPSGVHPSTNRPRALPHSPTRIVPPVTHSLYQNQY